MKKHIKNLIDNVANDKFAPADDALKAALANKVNDALIQKKIEVAGKIYAVPEEKTEAVKEETDLQEISFKANLKLVKKLPLKIRKDVEKMAKGQKVKISNDTELLNYIFNDENALDIAAQYLDV